MVVSSAPGRRVRIRISPSVRTKRSRWSFAIGMLRGLPCASFLEDQLELLGSECLRQDRAELAGQRRLEDVELIRVRRALRDALTQPECAVDEHGIAKAGFGVDRQSHARDRRRRETRGTHPPSWGSRRPSELPEASGLAASHPARRSGIPTASNQRAMRPSCPSLPCSRMLQQGPYLPFLRYRTSTHRAICGITRRRRGRIRTSCRRLPPWPCTIPLVFGRS
jgi:hypothetical protein